MCNCTTCRYYRAVQFSGAAERARQATAFARAEAHVQWTVKNDEPLESFHNYEPVPSLLPDPYLDPDGLRYR